MRVTPLSSTFLRHNMKEEWKDVVGYEGLYQVSNHGRIRSLDRLRHYSDGRASYVQKGKVMSLQENGKGRLILKLVNSEGRGKGHQVHILELEAFKGIRPPGYVGCHNDSDPLNNKIDNLRWDTPAGNEADKVANGTSNRGERHGNSKLTQAQVMKIRERLKAGESQRKIAPDFGVHQVHISKINRGLRWAHLEV